MIRRRVRHMNRYRDIAIALTRHGFGFIVKEMDIFHFLSLPGRIGKGTPKADKQSAAERIRLVVEDLGPTFIKLGQIASTRADLIPESIISELEKLQDQVAPFSYTEAQDILEAELKLELDSTFASFEQTPLAAASIGQVHFARLHTGEKVAVKIQRPGIDKTIRTDLEILQNLAVLAEARFAWAKRHQISQILEQFSKSLLQELDYTIEGYNTDRIAKQFKRDPTIHIPRVFWEFSSKKVLTTEFLDGYKINTPELLPISGYDPAKLAERLLHAVLHQIFIEGFFHADPHPGNIMVLRGNVLAFLDFGLVGRLSPEMKRHFSNLIIALMLQSTEGVLRALLGMRLVTPEASIAELRHDIDLLREKYVGIAFSQISLGEAVQDLLDVAYRHQVHIPSDFVLLGKSLITVEGVVEQLAPELSIMQIAEPFGRRLLKEKLHPKSIFGTLKEEWSQYNDMLLQIPGHLKGLLSMVNRGRLEVSVSEIDLLLKKLDRIGNRISFSIVLLSFSIVMTGIMISFSRNSAVSVLLELGALVASFMFIWLIHSIFKSGRF